MYRFLVMIRLSLKRFSMQLHEATIFLFFYEVFLYAWHTLKAMICIFKHILWSTGILSVCVCVCVCVSVCMHACMCFCGVCVCLCVGGVGWFPLPELVRGLPLLISLDAHATHKRAPSIHPGAIITHWMYWLHSGIQLHT